MKKTTYILIGAFLTGMAAVCAVSLFFLLNMSDEPDRRDFTTADTSNMVETTLPSFSALKVDDPYKITIRATDSVTTPVMTCSETAKDALIHKMKGDTLCLSYADTDSYDNTFRLTITVPAGCLSYADNPYGSLTLQDFTAHEMTVGKTNRLTLKGCELSVLSVGNSPKMKLSGSTNITELTISDCSKLRLTCETATDRVDRLTVTGAKDSNPSVNLSEAHIGTVNLNPADSTQQITVTVNRKGELKVENRES
ncbi:MAG: hypothetical protein NC212_05510 [Staphylococcus sp.]|nr:hypothetical protein [Staphylococcus sp.]